MCKQSSSAYRAENSYLTKLMVKYQQKECLIPYYKLLNTSLFHLLVFTMYTIFIWNLLFILFSYNLYDYSNNYVSFDIFCVLNVIALKCFAHLVFKGRIPAYYRQEYKNFHWLFHSYVVVFYGAFLRLPFYLYNHYEEGIELFKYIFNGKMFLLTTICTLFIIFIMFYSERLVKVRDFNNAVIYLNNQQKNQSIIAVQDTTFFTLLNNLKDNEKAQQKVKKIEKEIVSPVKNFLYDGDNISEKLIYGEMQQTTPVQSNTNSNTTKSSNKPIQMSGIKNEEVDKELQRFSPSIRKYIKKETPKTTTNTIEKNVSKKETNNVIDLQQHKKRPS